MEKQKVIEYCQTALNVQVPRNTEKNKKALEARFQRAAYEEGKDFRIPQHIEKWKMRLILRD